MHVCLDGIRLTTKQRGVAMTVQCRWKSHCTASGKLVGCKAVCWAFADDVAVLVECTANIETIVGTNKDILVILDLQLKIDKCDIVQSLCGNYNRFVVWRWMLQPAPNIC